jgi:hypothetical protein
VARCSVCGFQRLGCDHTSGDGGVWTGVWPGDDECREFNLWTKWTDHGWEQTTPADPEATPDLNALALKAANGELFWNGARWVAAVTSQ